MKPVICFGEALIDFLNFNDVQDGILNLKEFRQYPGGAPANVAVAIAKLGGTARFAGQVGRDPFGDFLKQSMEEYGVDTQHLLRHPHASTALAFVMLDERGERSFSFYRDQTADILFPQDQASTDWFELDSILHFCSNTLTTPQITTSTRNMVECARQAQAMVSFDVNLRHNLWPTGGADIQSVNQFVFSADLVKFSQEELAYLAQGDPLAYIEHGLSEGVQLLVVTDAEQDIHYYTAAGSGQISPPTVQAVDTTAGGDGFMGGLLYALSRLDGQLPNEQASLNNILTFASHCGALAVTRRGAFPALPTFTEVERHWPR